MIDTAAMMTGVPSNVPLAIVGHSDARLALKAPNDEREAIEGALSLEKLRKQRSDYVSAKRDERDEAEEARRYYHGDQWSSEEVRVQNERRQPVITYNRVAKKINGIVGLVERLRQDPKAYPRPPNQQAGADIATAVLNYALDANAWKSISPVVAKDGALEPVAGIELSLEPGDQGDPDVGMYGLEPDTIFYDPRSSKEDFSDAGYMGIDKFVRLDDAIGMFPDFEDQLREMATNGGPAGGYDDLAETDRQQVWAKVQEKSVRICEHWYKSRGEWLWAFYTYDTILDQGVSPFIDEKGRTFCRFILFSANVDHDNDRYGFVRNLKGAQDEINHRRAKGLHGLNTIRVYLDESVDDDRIEVIRGEINRPDGVIKLPQGSKVEEKNNAEQVAGNLQMMTEAKQEIESYGPNPSLVGGGTGDQSGRAIQLLQQAGIAELGPYILGYRDWKVRVYRAIWNLVQRNWTAERWVRVTDDDGIAQFLAVNRLGFDPVSGQPTMENALGSLDVDIIVDEGPDHETLMEDTLQALMALAPGMAQAGKPLPPEIIIELVNIPQATKKKILAYLEQSSQPNPLKEAADKLQLQGAAAKLDETAARATNLRAQAQRALQPDPSEPVDPIDRMHTAAKTRKDLADAQATEADTALRVMPFVPPSYGPVEQRYAQGQPPEAMPY